MIRMTSTHTHTHVHTHVHAHTHTHACTHTLITNSMTTDLLLSGGIRESDVSELHFSLNFLTRKHHTPSDGHAGPEFHILKHTCSSTHTTDNLTKKDGKLTKGPAQNSRQRLDTKHTHNFQTLLLAFRVKYTSFCSNVHSPDQMYRHFLKFIGNTEHTVR